MKIVFASDYIEGTNTEAIYKVAMQRGIDCVYISKDKCIGNTDGANIAITNNGRWIQDWNVPLKVNTQHGQGFLGDSTPERGIHVCLVSCDAEKEKYIANGYSPLNLIVTGRPRLDRMFNCDHESIRQDYLNSLGLDINKPTVLYAPTYDRKAHGGGTKGFFARWCKENEEITAAEHLADLCISHNIIIRLHKYYAKQYKNLIPDYLVDLFKGRAIITSTATHPDSIPAMITADVLITDFSSIAFDYLALDRPIVFIEPHDKWKYTNKWFCPKQDRVKMGVVIHDPFQMWKFINARSHWTKIIAPLRKRMIYKYVQFLDGKSSERALDGIIRIYNERHK